ILFSEKVILKTLGGYSFWNLILFCHYGARLVQIFLSCEQLKTRVSVRILIRFNVSVYLFLYLIISHVIGASWYYLSIQRQLSCWNDACKIDSGCIFHCDGTNPSSLNSTLVHKFCPLNPQKFGIYLDALQSGIVEDKGVLKKFLQCFFWGLRHLSSFASNLHTSTNDGETFFAIIISVVALILLICIIGNIQRYAGLESARFERIVDKMELIKELMEGLVVFHKLDDCTKKLTLEHIQEAFENDNESFNFERLFINHFRNDDNKKESVLKDLSLLEKWAFNGQPDNLGKAKKWLFDNNIPRDRNNILFYLTFRLKDDEDVNLTSVFSVLPDESKWMTMKDLCFHTLKK
ncbi:hypothetical protein UlMin_016245, partial [Ulmus minor]